MIEQVSFLQCHNLTSALLKKTSNRSSQIRNYGVLNGANISRNSNHVLRNATTVFGYNISQYFIRVYFRRNACGQNIAKYIYISIEVVNSTHLLNAHMLHFLSTVKKTGSRSWPN